MTSPSQTPNRQVAVIGGGLAGLASAARLAHAGAQVHLFERNPTPGGKIASYSDNGYRWDLGPSLLTMPHLLRELWEECGEPFENVLTLTPLERTCRYRWADGTVFDEDAAFWQRPDTAAFLRRAAGVYALSEHTFLRDEPAAFLRHFKASHLPRLRHLPSIADPRSLHDTNRRFFQDPHLVQLFDRFATYNGSSPFETPAAFAIIPFVQARFGGWYVQGGMEKIAQAVSVLALHKGAAIETGITVTAIEPVAGGYRLAAEGRDLGLFDAVVCTRDAIAATADLLPEPFRHPPRTASPASTSGFVMLLGMRGQFPQLDHHNILFSSDYRAEFDDLFREKRPPNELTIYIAISSKDDPERAPAGCENWFVLVNAPALDPAHDWERDKAEYAERVLDRIEAFGFPDLRRQIETQHLITPRDFSERDLSWRGALYGYASHGSLAAFRRPPVEIRGLPGFYFAGGTTHPGGGIPLVLRSAKIAAERAARHLGLADPTQDR